MATASTASALWPSEADEDAAIDCIDAERELPGGRPGGIGRGVRFGTTMPSELVPNCCTRPATSCAAISRRWRSRCSRATAPAKLRLLDSHCSTCTSTSSRLGLLAFRKPNKLRAPPSRELESLLAVALAASAVAVRVLLAAPIPRELAALIWPVTVDPAALSCCVTADPAAQSCSATDSSCSDLRRALLTTSAKSRPAPLMLGGIGGMSLGSSFFARRRLMRIAEARSSSAESRPAGRARVYTMPTPSMVTSRSFATPGRN